MSINVKYFASLREAMGRSDEELTAEGVSTVADVWDRVSARSGLAPTTLIAVNMEYVQADHPVRDGDEVAFFPPVTGG